MKRINYIEPSFEKAIIEKVGSITVDTYYLDNGLDDHIVIILDDQYTINGTLYNAIIFERHYATTWSNSTDVIFTNDEKFVNEFIEKHDHEKIYI